VDQDGVSHSRPTRRRHRPIATPNHVLAVTLIAFATLALVVAVETPPGEANDEPSHVQNVETLASGAFYDITPLSGSESHQAPLYYGFLAVWQHLFDAKSTKLTFEVAPLRSTAARPHFLHDTLSDAVQQQYFDLLRVAGIAMGLATIMLTWLTIRWLTRDPWTPVLAAAIVAFVPRFLFLAGVVNNDNLATLVGASATCLAIWLVHRRPDSTRVRLAWAAAAGVLLGAALLTKVTAVVVGPGLLLALVLVVRSARERIALVAVMGVGAVVVSGWWLLRNQLLYGDPLASAASIAHLRAILPKLFHLGNPLVRVLVTIPEGIWKSAWYVSGSNQFSWPPLAYAPFWFLLGLGLIGVLVRWSPESREGVAVLVLMALGGAAAIWIVGLQTSQAQARIGFVGLPAIAGLTALGYERLRLPTLARFALPVLGLVGVLVAIRTDVINMFH
jgi:hypothetical protein